jgi:CRP-like cAMP-binding protein
MEKHSAHVAGGAPPSPAEWAAIGTALRAIVSLTDAQLEPFRSELRIHSFEAGGLLVREGDTVSRVGLVLRGVFKTYYNTEQGECHVCSFYPEGSFVGAYFSGLTGRPSRTQTEAIEPSRVACIPFRFLLSLFERDPIWDKLGRRIAETLYVGMVQREECLMTLDAKARLGLFREKYPTLGDRVRKSDIASYINVRPETLSRLLRR